MVCLVGCPWKRNWNLQEKILTNNSSSLSSICFSRSWVLPLPGWLPLKDTISHCTQDCRRVFLQVPSISADCSRAAETESATIQLQQETRGAELGGGCHPTLQRPVWNSCLESWFCSLWDPQAPPNPYTSKRPQNITAGSISTPGKRCAYPDWDQGISTPALMPFRAR